MQPEIAASPEHLYELGLTTAAMSFHTAAIEALRDCVAAAPDHALAWRKLAEMLRLAKEDDEADAAEREGERALLTCGKWKPAMDDRPVERLKKAEAKLLKSLHEKQAGEVAAALRERLVGRPTDSAAIRLLAAAEIQTGDAVTARQLLERALDLSPHYLDVRDDYAAFLIQRGDYPPAAAQTEILIAQDPKNARFRMMHANASMHVGNFEVATKLITRYLRDNPGDPEAWLSYAQTLRFAGRYDESLQAIRRCLELKPDMGQAYWALADLKGKFLTDEDIAMLREYLSGDSLDRSTRAYMLYALAHGLERRQDFANSFAAYEEGARLFFEAIEEEGLRRPQYERESSPNSSRFLRRNKQVFTKENFVTKFVQAPATPELGTPLFVIGMPRAGSTLVEQILSSHSWVEGTRELPLIGDITRRLTLSRLLVASDAYPEILLDLSREKLAALGREYLERSKIFRKTNRLYFVDKRPWNWLQVGLIHLILPHAKIIDVRREPMAAGFAMFKQLLPLEASFSYNLKALGEYYNKYVNMMEHWHTVLPGRVHFLQYEKLVENNEAEIRRLLEYCGLPFEEQCLRFWETDRVVATPSAEQVRRPIFRDALEQWRNFEPWLGPLKEALNRPAEA